MISLCSAHTKRHTHCADACFPEPVKSSTLISIVGLILRVKATERRFAQARAASNQRLTEVKAHDLLSPLCTISSLAAWIREEYVHQLGACAREYLGLLDQSVERMREVIVRTFGSSIQHGQIDYGLKRRPDQGTA